MADPSNPAWWSADGQDGDDDGSYQRFFDGSDGAATSTAMPQAQRVAEGLLDSGQSGMPLDSKDFYNGRIGELDEIERKIAQIESNLREHGVELVENMKGADDEDDDEPKKRFMPIADLPPSPLFFSPSSYDDGQRQQPEAVVDVGRRLKDGAHLPAVRAPVLGVTTPIYIKDAVGPMLLVLGGLLACVLYVLLRQNRLARQLREAEKALQEERTRSHRALLDALAYGGRMGTATAAAL